LALNFVVNWEEGAEYSFLDDERNEGQGEFRYPMGQEFRDLAVESAYEYGGRAGIWRLLRLFDEYQLATTFFACGLALERNPLVGEWMSRGGHEPCGHGYRWSEHWLFGSVEEEQEQIYRAISAIERACGERPRGWYSRYSASPYTRSLLVAEGGFVYDSDAYNDDLPYFTEVQGIEHLVIPYTFVYNDGWIINQGYGSPSDFVSYCRSGLDELLREGRAGAPKMMSIGLHARWMGQAARTAALREFIEYVLSQDDVWITRRIDIADWWLEHHQEFRE
jgi:peptidoglycan/xylan/chitin deacetylase (PgdA/CDA1 family)